MDSTAGAPSSQIFQRTLIVLLSASLLISLFVFFLHGWYHTDLTDFLGISNRSQRSGKLLFRSFDFRLELFRLLRRSSETFLGLFTHVFSILLTIKRG